MKSKGMIARKLRKQAAKQVALAGQFIIPATVREHLTKAAALEAQAKALFN